MQTCRSYQPPLESGEHALTVEHRHQPAPDLRDPRRVHRDCVLDRHRRRLNPRRRRAIDAHEPIDLANPKANEGNPGYLPEERAWFDKWAGAGYADSFRRLCPEPGTYSWWTYRVPSAREKNIGWRLDYHCVDEGLMPAVSAATIHPEVRGSDHCPVGIELEL